MHNNLDRRRFLAGSAAVAGAAVLGAPSILSARAPGDKLGIAVIGCGNQGGGNPGIAARERLVALVDIDEKFSRKRLSAGHRFPSRGSLHASEH